MKALLLLSGGIDSPVAGYLMKKQLELVPVYFENSPYAGKDTMQRAEDSARKLGFKKMAVTPHGSSLKAYAEKCERRYLCVFCKRQMLRVAEELAKEKGASCVIMGDNLAQVASQTLHNLFVVSSAVKIPVVRPLIGFDKEEIIGIAKKIGTYDISTRRVSCCSAVPEKPSTKASLQAVEAEEAKLDVGKLVKESLNKMRELVL
jgi:thiamine biosynthesis protein ThiI